MAPLAYARTSPLVRRARADNCSGWDCLGDAAQFGIILVIVVFALTMGYMYWRLKIKPNRANRSDAETTVGGYWEVTRRDPNRVSITIYRGQRPSNGPEASRLFVGTERAAAAAVIRRILRTTTRPGAKPATSAPQQAGSGGSTTCQCTTSANHTLGNLERCYRNQAHDLSGC
ncbi:hypothetical protein VTG60DRAFT_3103 [Thermothelomyces hinnuleus]